MVTYYSVVLRRQMPVLGGMTVSLVGVTIVGYSKIVVRSFLVRFPPVSSSAVSVPFLDLVRTLDPGLARPTSFTLDRIPY